MGRGLLSGYPTFCAGKGILRRLAIRDHFQNAGLLYGDSIGRAPVKRPGGLGDAGHLHLCGDGRLCSSAVARVANGRRGCSRPC